MAGLFDDIKPKEKKIPDNIQINQSMFSDLLPSEDKYQFKITDKGNPGSNLSINDATEPGLFDDLVPQVDKVTPENKNKYDKLEKKFHDKVNQGYEKISNSKRFIKIDASKSIQSIHKKIIKNINLII